MKSKFNYCCPHILIIGAAGLLLMAHAEESAEPPPGAIESPETAQELAVAAQRFIDALDPGMKAKYLFQDAERGNFHFFPIRIRIDPGLFVRS